jgi:hypothetical protein
MDLNIIGRKRVDFLNLVQDSGYWKNVVKKVVGKIVFLQVGRIPCLAEEYPSSAAVYSTVLIRKV